MLDNQPKTMLGPNGANLVPMQTPRSQAKTVTDDNTGNEVGAVSGLKDVTVSTRVTTSGKPCKLPLVYRCAFSGPHAVSVDPRAAVHPSSLFDFFAAL
jgi:hypothetical protein